ncbi:hypothetical protein B0H11DRAFT_1913080 [Mycena galericulata]|nr:hypothetical protein B0H11DRAFT_1913080 [Mycena galericulata]
MNKQRVLLLGATGQTGGMPRRSYDLPQPRRRTVKKLAELGVKIRVADIEGATEELVKSLDWGRCVDQRHRRAEPAGADPSRDSRKGSGVKRFVPCAFITVAPPGGVMALRDSKEEVYQQIWKLFLPYTIIDVGFWHQLSFPTLPSGRVDYAAITRPKIDIHAGGSAPTMLTDLRDIGAFVARIIRDARTLNKFVVTYSDVLSENEIFALMEEMSGEKIERKYASPLSVSAEDITASRARAAAALKTDPTNVMARLMSFSGDYDYSKYVRGDNTPAYATYLGYLDARELYPDFQPRRFREFIVELLDGKVEKPYKNRGFD